MLPTLATQDVALFAISYDAVAILRGFATEHGISFPLLSDEGSDVIRRLGLLNERVQEDHAAYGVQPNPRHLGVPYPGVFVLDERGIVVRKRFHESYRERDTGSGLIADTLEGLGVTPVIDEPQQHPSGADPRLARLTDLRLVSAPPVDHRGRHRPGSRGVRPSRTSRGRAPHSLSRTHRGIGSRSDDLAAAAASRAGNARGGRGAYGNDPRFAAVDLHGASWPG